MGNEYLGEFEQLVLLAVLRLGDEAYGVTIRETIEERAERRVSFGAVYSTLRRLEAKGCLESGQGNDPGAPPVPGRPKKTFTLTTEGMKVLHAAQRRIQRMADGIGALNEFG